MIDRGARALLVLALAAALAPAAAKEGGGPPPDAGGTTEAQAADPNAPPAVDPNAPEGQSVEPEVLPPSAYAEGERPPAKEKTYDARRAKVWAAVLVALKKADVPVESSDQVKGDVRTQLIAFDHTRFDDVATRPPTMSRDRPVFQFIHLNQGWFSVEIHVAEAKKGTSVSVRAYIEESARHILKARRVRAERYSNGRIEDYFFAKFDEALK